MEQKELMEQLDALKTKLEGKTAEEVKTAIDNFKEENKELLNVDFKAISESLEGLKEVPTNLVEMQKHLDKLDVRLQKKDKQDALQTRDTIKNLIVENFGTLSEVVRKGRVSVMDEKAAGVMTLSASLTTSDIAPRATIWTSPIRSGSSEYLRFLWY